MLRGWVKNVYKLGTGVGKTSGLTSPYQLQVTSSWSMGVGNYQVIPVLVHSFYPRFSTRQLSDLTLLNIPLSPHSTPPTINTKKEK